MSLICMLCIGLPSCRVPVPNPALQIKLFSKVGFGPGQAGGGSINLLEEVEEPAWFGSQCWVKNTKMSSGMAVTMDLCMLCNQSMSSLATETRSPTAVEGLQLLLGGGAGWEVLQKCSGWCGFGCTQLGVVVLDAGRRQDRQFLQHDHESSLHISRRHAKQAAFIHMHIWGFGWVPLGMQRIIYDFG